MRKQFVIGMVIYAVVFLVIAGIGLTVFWNYIDAYEQSRPMNTVKAYVSSVTVEDMVAGSEELFSRLDTNIQSREEASSVISAALTGELSYAKKSGESTETKQVYVLRSGRQAIGRFAITAGEPDAFGFRIWSVSETGFDFTYLLGEPVSLTVPAEYTVCINGVQLDESYITARDIPYSALEEFYGDYDLPTMVTYTAEGFLGSYAMEATDPDGYYVILNADTDMNSLLPLCPQDISGEMDTFVKEFLNRYVTFTSSANNAAASNYARLKAYLVENGALAKRLYTAIDGLQFAQSYGDSIRKITVNRTADLGGDRYLCDVTYIVETWGTKGAVETTNNLKLIILDTGSGLRVEAMTRY